MRFKVGQKVRVVRPYSDSDFHDGEIVEIVGISPNAYYGQDCYKAISCENKDKDWWCLCENEVEPIPNGNNATPITNGDKIRSMSNRELAEFLFEADYEDSACVVCPHRYTDYCDTSGAACVDGFEAWLNSPVEDK